MFKFHFYHHILTFIYTYLSNKNDKIKYVDRKLEISSLKWYITVSKYNWFSEFIWVLKKLCSSSLHIHRAFTCAYKLRKRKGFSVHCRLTVPLQYHLINKSIRVKFMHAFLFCSLPRPANACILMRGCYVIILVQCNSLWILKTL